MKKLIALSAIFFAVVLTSNVFAQSGNSDMASSSAKATIITPILIENNRQLHFGTIASTPAGGNVTASATETTNITFDNPDAEVTTLSAPTSAKFTVTGEEDAVFGISFSTATLTGAGDDMDITNFVSSVGTTDVQLDGTTKVFYVGATLEVNANQAPGEYTGSFDVTVVYN